MLAAPATTPYDLRFRLLSIPVRVHPLFWLTTVLLGWSSFQGGDFQPLVIWVVCVLLSILVHEFGHALTARAFGFRPIILLYSMGGLCDSEGDRQTPKQRLLVLFGGPGAGFALLVATLAVASLVFKLTIAEDIAACRDVLGLDPGPEFGSAAVKLGVVVTRGAVKLTPQFLMVRSLVFINLLWSLINLLPVYPLDGGQIAGVLLQGADRRRGLRRTHILSMATAGVVSAYFFWQQNILTGLLFAFLALTNFQILQAIQHQARYGGLGEEDDADWWKR